MEKACINCSKPIKDLYKCYTSNVIKISECDRCRDVADKYVEFERIIVFIDLALLQTATYRHVLFNTDFQKYWKFSIILIFVETYLKWNNVFYLTNNRAITSDERGFYISCFFVLLEHLLFFSSLYGLMFVLGHPCTVRLLWKAITLSNFAKLLFLPILIWRESISQWELKVNYMIIISYLTLSLVCSCSVVSKQSRSRTTLLILISMGVRQLCISQLEGVISSSLYLQN